MYNIEELKKLQSTLKGMVASMPDDDVATAEELTVSADMQVLVASLQSLIKAQKGN